MALITIDIGSERYSSLLNDLIQIITIVIITHYMLTLEYPGKNIANIKILKQKALKALQRSIIARQIAIDENIDGTEAIQISAMLYDFGEYLVALFSPDVFINIEIYADEKNVSNILTCGLYTITMIRFG